MDTPTQPQVTPASPSTEPNVVELQAQLEESKKQREGLLRDLQQERTKRQELEANIVPPASPAVTPGAQDDEVEKLLGPIIEKRIAPLKAQLADKEALTYLSSKTNKTVDEVLNDKDLQAKLMGIARKWQLVGDSYSVSKRAFELMELENLKLKEEERARATSVASATSLPTGTGSIVTSTVKKYSAEEFNAMDPKVFGQLAKQGDFRKLPDGSFEHISR